MSWGVGVFENLDRILNSSTRENLKVDFFLKIIKKYNVNSSWCSRKYWLSEAFY